MPICAMVIYSVENNEKRWIDFYFYLFLVRRIAKDCGRTLQFPNRFYPMIYKATELHNLK